MIYHQQFLRDILHDKMVTVGLPWLELFSSRKAFANDGFPLRFGVFFWGNGNRPEEWTPTDVGADFVLPHSLTPLSSLRDRMTIISGMSVKVPNLFPHWSGAVGLITGQAAVGTEEDWTVGAPSIDQVIAQAIGGETVYRSIEVGCVTNQSMSWAGPNIQNPVDDDPYHFYERLFGSTFREPGEEGIVDPSLGFRRSVLDSVMSDISDLESRLGAADLIRLEQHLDGVRELEQRLARLQEDPPALEACLRPDEPEANYEDIDSRPQLVERNEIMSKLIAMSLACDQTRVFSYTYTSPLNNILFPDATDGHHNLTHHEVGEQPQVKEITNMCISAYATLLQELENIDEGEGTLLDNCAVLCCSEVSEGRTHSLDEIPIIIGGGAGGGLVTGKHFRSFTQSNVNEVMLSLQRIMGIPATSYGFEDSEVTDSFTDMEA